MNIHHGRARQLGVIAAFASIAVLAGCGSAVNQATGQPTASPGTSSSSTATSSTATSSTATPSVTLTADAGTASAPSDPVAKAAWEALMGPEGEYAAAASYAAVIDKFGAVEPYVTIKGAEERHIAALTRQLQRLGVSVPANPWLSKLPAPADLTKAAQAWADGEVANVAMYDNLMAAAATDAPLTRVFTNLRRSSQEEHLPMFRAAAASGGTLTSAQLAQLGH